MSYWPWQISPILRGSWFPGKVTITDVYDEIEQRALMFAVNPNIGANHAIVMSYCINTNFQHIFFTLQLPEWVPQESQRWTHLSLKLFPNTRLNYHPRTQRWTLIHLWSRKTPCMWVIIYRSTYCRDLMFTSLRCVIKLARQFNPGAMQRFLQSRLGDRNGWRNLYPCWVRSFEYVSSFLIDII